jgi:hypothetical protein
MMMMMMIKEKFINIMMNIIFYFISIGKLKKLGRIGAGKMKLITSG